MPLLCITITKQDQEVQLPNEIGSQEAILRMVTYDQVRKKNVTGHPSWELNISDMLGNSNEIKHSPGHEKAGNTRLPLPNIEYMPYTPSNHVASASHVAGALYPNIKFHLGHLGTGGTRISVHQTNHTGSTPFWSRTDKETEIHAHESDTTSDATIYAAAPNWYFREIKLYFEYQTNDHLHSHS